MPGISNDCFADEIAIDFPSVVHLIERVRAGFLGAPDSADILATEVELSSHEALRGTVVPLLVPVLCACSRCGGRGETWPDPCGSCAGTGNRIVNDRIRIAIPAGVVDGARLRFRVNAPQAPEVSVEVRIAVRSSAV
jgi:hypothetical protein